MSIVLIYNQIQPIGVADKATLSKMAAARCGIADRESKPSAKSDVEVQVSLSSASSTSLSRRRRYVLMGYKWSRLNLSYRVQVYTRKVPRAKVDSEIADSFKVSEYFQ